MLRNWYQILFVYILAMGAARGETKVSLDILGAGSFRNIADSDINPGNRIFQISKSNLDLELRPELKWTSSDKVDFIGRGRWIGSHDSYDAQKSTDQGRLDLTDLYVTWETWTNARLVVGLQNFQWGPGELYSPSNPFFHFNSRQKSFFYKEKGRSLIRLSLDLSENFQAMLMTEPLDNNDKYWIEDRPFNSKSAIKFEYTFLNRADYLSFVVGSEELYQPFVGEYFNWVFNDSVSIYFDFRQTQGEAFFQPQVNIYNSYDLLPSEDKSSIRTLNLLGIRWEASSWDLRFEYVYNSAGYSAHQWNQAATAATVATPSLSMNLRRFLRPGLEFYTQSYLYSSLRIPDFLTHEQNIYLRNLLSQLDSSGFFQLDLDRVLSDSSVFYFEHTQFYGPKNSEFHSENDYQISVGIKYSI